MLAEAKQYSYNIFKDWMILSLNNNIINNILIIKSLFSQSSGMYKIRSKLKIDKVHKGKLNELRTNERQIHRIDKSKEKRGETAFIGSNNIFLVE